MGGGSKYNCGHPVSWCNKHPAGFPSRSPGLTLMELLVVLVILSVLASAALPFAEITVRREKEWELRRALREVRTALDRIHNDWEQERISKLERGMSTQGWPKSLAVLVEGVDLGDAGGHKQKYLRRIPGDPFADPALPPADQWALRGYGDDADASAWGSEDVYDVHSRSGKVAIDGTQYKSW